MMKPGPVSTARMTYSFRSWGCGRSMANTCASETVPAMAADCATQSRTALQLLNYNRRHCRANSPEGWLRPDSRPRHRQLPQGGRADRGPQDRGRRAAAARVGRRSDRRDQHDRDATGRTFRTRPSTPTPRSPRCTNRACGGMKPSLSVDVETTVSTDLFAQMRSVLTLQRGQI